MPETLLILTANPILLDRRQAVSVPSATSTIPEPIWHRIKSFLDAKQTGNLVLHVREGQVLGAKIEEHLSIR